MAKPYEAVFIFSNNLLQDKSIAFLFTNLVETLSEKHLGLASVQFEFVCDRSDLQIIMLISHVQRFVT